MKLIAALLPLLAPTVPASFQEDSPLARALEVAGANRPQIERALERVTEAQRPGMEFLVAHMPEEDLLLLSADYLLDNCAFAYGVMGEVKWGADVPEEVFLNYVLPYANVNERRDEWRDDFKQQFLPRVRECETPSEAAALLNREVFEVFGVKYSTKRAKADQSPLETIESGLASCTGLSILLADACRSVGVPARLAGIPHWANKDGNHTWVEIWDDGWHFTGAAEPDARGLDHAWFEHDASLARADDPRHSIWATSWEPTGTSFPMVWAPEIDWVPAVNVTTRYTRAREELVGHGRLLVRAVRGSERIAVPVRVRELGGDGVWEGTTKDESADTNDILAFVVPRGRRYRVEAAVQQNAGALEVEFDEEQAIHTLELAAPRDGPRGPGVPELVRERLWAGWKKNRSLSWKDDFDARRVRSGEHESPYTVKEVGERPDGGWPLFIALHGGGGTTQEINDSQWRHMQVYYHDHPEKGGYKYVALRAPNNTWNGFYDDYVYPLIEKLIQQFLVHGDVDPDRVHVMGYSHGGYGAFAIGPKIPDRFASIHASAAAPTDGESSAVNLRNTVMTFMIGEKDTAYGRAERCLRFAEELRELRGKSGFYPVRMEFIEGHGHGGLPDRDKILDMIDHRRNTRPTSLTWQLTDAVVRDFFWLSVDDPAKGKSVKAFIEDDLVTIETENVARLTVWLDERLVDLSQPVRFRVNGGELAERTLAPSAEVFATSLERRGDPGLAFSVRVDLDLE